MLIKNRGQYSYSRILIIFKGYFLNTLFSTHSRSIMSMLHIRRRIEICAQNCPLPRMRGNRGATSSNGNTGRLFALYREEMVNYLSKEQNTQNREALQYWKSNGLTPNPEREETQSSGSLLRLSCSQDQMRRQKAHMFHLYCCRRSMRLFFRRNTSQYKSFSQQRVSPSAGRPKALR